MTTTEQLATGNLRTVVVSSIEKVTAEEWDGVGARQGLFWTHRFFRALEASGVENATYHYVLMYDHERLVGTEVLSSFVVSLDLLLPMAVQNLCRFVRKLLPNFMRIRVLFCGVPISIGKHTIAVIDPAYADAAMSGTAAVMEDIAVRDSIRYLCFKEFAERDIAICLPLERHGFFRANSVPRVLLPLKWASYDAYLHDMRHGYRRAVLNSLQKLGEHWRIWAREETPPPGGVHLRLDDGQVCAPLTFHGLYRQVMDHTVVKLETLNAQFFERLFAEMRDDLKVLVLQCDGEVLGAAIIAHWQKTLTFLFVGFDYERRDQHAVYLSLLNGIVRYAIDSGCNTIDLGQTSYWLKQRLGGQAEPMYFYLKCRTRILHTALRSCRRLLFPATDLPRLRVFRD
jgi:predicted N-acyltransferase